MLDPYATASRDQQLMWVAGAKRGVRSDAEKLVRSIRRFLYAMTKGYTNDPNLREDLYSEACYAVLCFAVPKFDPGMGITFLSYAVFWARSYMSKYFNDNMTPIRLPANLVKFYKRSKAGKETGATSAIEKEVALFDFFSANLPTKGNERESLLDWIASASDEEIEQIFSKDYLDRVVSQLSETGKETARVLQERDELDMSRAGMARIMGVHSETLRQREQRLVREAVAAAKNLEKEAE